jgi:hypothetical protein
MSYKAFARKAFYLIYYLWLYPDYPPGIDVTDILDKVTLKHN